MDACVYAQRLIGDESLDTHEATVQAFLEERQDDFGDVDVEKIIRSFVEFVTERRENDAS